MKTGLIENRRNFLIKTVPACFLTCAGIEGLLAEPAKKQTESEETPKHKFQDELCQTYEKAFQSRFNFFIRKMDGLGDLMGREKLVALLQKSTEANIKIPEKVKPENSFEVYKTQFKNRELFKHTLIFKIVEDTETVFALNVLECLWANTFHNRKAGDLGYASICCGDFNRALAFHPNLQLERTQTRMQGADFCNFRYHWKAS